MLTRRDVLALAGIGAALGGAAACGYRSTADAAPAFPAVRPRVGTRWSARPDGPMPVTGDEGLPVRAIAQDAPPPSVEGGALVGHLPDRQSATYVLQDLAGAVPRVERIGAVFGFGPGAESGALALLAVDGQRAASGHVHLAVTPRRWIAGALVDGQVQEIDGDDHTAPLAQDGRPLRVDVAYRGDTAVLALPDGSVRTVTDARLGAGGAVVAGWEFFRLAPGGADVRFYETWAG